MDFVLSLLQEEQTWREMEVLKHQNFNKWLKSGLKQTKDQPLHNAVNLKACSFMANDIIEKYIK